MFLVLLVRSREGCSLEWRCCSVRNKGGGDREKKRQTGIEYYTKLSRKHLYILGLTGSLGKGNL
jgi:hypothetical protein